MVPEALRPAEEAVAMLIEIMGPQDELPAGLWDDPFLLGFIFYTLHAVGTVSGASDDDFRALPEIYSNLLEGDGEEAFRRTIALQKAEDRGFWAGLEASAKFQDVIQGSAEKPVDRDAIEIWRQAAEDVQRDLKEGAGELTLEEALFIRAYDFFFMAEIRRRFLPSDRLN